MLPRIAGAATAAFLGLSNSVAAQFGTLPAGVFVSAVTFTLPLNLTQLPPDLERVKFVCAVFGEGMASPLGTLNTPPDPTSESYPFKQELFVTGGQVVATASVQVVMLLDGTKDPLNKPAHYRCGVMGYSKSLNRWEVFSETPSAPVFMLKPAPVIEGTFNW